MKPTEFWTWCLKGEGGRRYRMRGKYTEATANSYWPSEDPQKVPGSLEVRNLPETSEELQETHPGSWLNYPKAVTSRPVLAQPNNDATIWHGASDLSGDVCSGQGANSHQPQRVDFGDSHGALA